MTAAAGPLANVFLAIVSAVAFGLVARFAPMSAGSGGLGIATLLTTLTVINVSLALFNLIPIPPLDGSRVVDGLLPLSWRPQWQSIVRLSPLLLVALIAFGGNIISGPAMYVMGWLGKLTAAIM